jgi:hypothetical protein
MKKNILGLIACGGTASRIFNIPKFILPLKNKNLSLLSNWCMLMIEKRCDKIIIGSSVANNSFIEHIINTQLNDYRNLIIIKIIHNTATMNETILKMVENENYDLAIMGMPDTHVDYISDNLINKILDDNEIIIGSYLWNVRNTQREKIGLCNIDDNYIIDIIDKNKDCDYNYGWGAIIFKKEFENYIKIDDLHLGYSMKLALNNSIKIPYEIINGQYWDCGTVSEYKEYLNFLEENKPVYIKGLLIIAAVYIEDDAYKLNVLKSCIAQFRNVYKNETIVIVDNKSKNVEWYDLAKSLNIYIIKNNSNLYRYEIGAYNLALKHFRADKYICVQGNIFLNNKITEELDDTKADAIVFKKHYEHETTWNNDNNDWDYISPINKYLNILDMKDRDKDRQLVQYSSFYCNKAFMDNMIEKGILDLICNKKVISCSYERILGTYFHRNLVNVKEINPETFTKFIFGQL